MGDATDPSARVVGDTTTTAVERSVVKIVDGGGVVVGGIKYVDTEVGCGTTIVGP